ncbi:hypothetical protein DEO72_LG7g944 [Vigna unguiculata]|uniref:Uncharacterized protein n=1 Tax=Vigna unguiculata TaxID=3917 RepID=A0A4D6MFY3_VIGUN|nr:hypothetical protein DEO72_LG7g944 [Vigna unguiculata]
MLRAGRYVVGGSHVLDYGWAGPHSKTTSGQVRRAELRAGRFIEAGPQAGSLPFLFVFGDDRVIHYTGANDITGDVGDA